MDVLDLWYYSRYYFAIFLLPFVAYILLFKQTSSYSGSKIDKGWFYVIKLYFATKEVRKFQQKRLKRQKKLGSKVESIVKFPTEQHANSQYIYGIDQNNNSISLKFILRSNKRAEVSLCLRVKDDVFTLPGEQNVRIYSVATQENWKVKGLNIEILDPFKKLRITFNGLLKKNCGGNKEIIEHVQFNFIWNCGGSPKYFPQDANERSLAESVASEVWRDGGWSDLLDDFDVGYEQFGALQGFIKGDSFPEDLILNLPSCRSKYFGVDVRFSHNRHVRIFLALHDGTLLNVVVKSFKNGCAQVNYGSAILNNGNVVAIDGTDIKLEFLAKHKNVPDLFTTHIKVGSKVFKCVLYLNTSKAVNFVNDEIKGSECLNIPAECDVNTSQARAVVELWYQRKGQGLDLPVPLLYNSQTSTLPNSFVTNLKSEEAKILELTGGKGNSLALLSSIETENFVIPDGFVVTVNAFKQQLHTIKKLSEAVAALEDICCGRVEGKLEEACIKTVEAFKSEKVIRLVAEAILLELKTVEENTKIETGSNRWAVRSSAIGEDSEELSAAGQNESFLGCRTGKDVLNAVTACWASLFTYQSVQYRWQHGLPVNSDMAVVVQKMVPADSAGVLFTCHPTTCNPSQMVITSNYGLGESVVSGKSDPDTFIIKKTYTGDVSVLERTIGGKNKVIRMAEDGLEEVDATGEIGASWSISEDEALFLARVGANLEEVFGGARDIEWAFYEKRLYLLQSRPVTTLNTWTDFELLHEFDVPILSESNVFTVANVAEVFPGASSVLSQTAIFFAVDQSLQNAVKMNFDPMVLKCLISRQHHVMMNVNNSLHRNVQKDIKISSKILDLAIFGHPVINETINSISLNRFGCATSTAILKETLRIATFAWKHREIMKDTFKSSNNLILTLKKADSVEEMYKKLSQPSEDFAKTCEYHCNMSSVSVFYQIVAMNLLIEKSEELTLEHCTDFAAILSSCEDVISAEIPAILEKISATIQIENLQEEFSKITPALGVEWLQNNCPNANKELEKFLEKHGHRLLGEMELKQDSWGMDPSIVIVMIQAICKNKSKLKKKVETVDEVMAKLVSPKSKITKTILRFLMRKIRVAVGNRENTKSEFVRSINKYRLGYRVLAEKMVLQGLLPNKELMYHLSHHELGQVIKKRSPLLISKAMRRQRLFSKWDELKFPEIIYGIPEAQQEEEYISGGGDVICTGTPVCNGTVKARACVITTLKNIDQLKAGDILITYSTDIGWSPYFPMLSGIVTELGGLVSHGAVIAREYGLPCIVGVQGATKLFKTGDVVLLVGKTGTLELVTEN